MLRKTPKITAAGRARYIQAMSGRAEVFHLIGLEQEALADFGEVLRLIPDASGKVNAASFLCDICVRLGRIPEARSQADRINRSLRGSRDPYLRGRALMIRAHVMRSTGDLRRALAVIHRAIGQFTRAPARPAVRDGIAHGYLNIGIIHYGFGEYDQARKHFAESARRMKMLGDRLGQIRALNNIGLIHWHRGELGQAERIFRRILRMAEAMGNISGIGYILQNLGLVVNDRDRLREGLAKFEAAVRYAGEVGDRGLMAINYNNIGITHERLNQYQPAHRNYARSRELFRAIGHRAGFAMACNNCAGIAAEWNRLPAALADADRAVRIARRGGYTDQLVRSCKTRGKILAGLGRDAAAARAIETAARLAKQHGMLGLSADAALEYVNAATGAWLRHSKGHYPRVRHYAARVEEDVQKGHLSGSDAVTAWLILARYYALYGPAARAGQALAEAVKKAGRTDNLRIAAEMALSRASVSFRLGKPWQDELRTARDMARKINARALLAYILELSDKFKRVK